jgi:hypothetical protein
MPLCYLPKPSIWSQLRGLTVSADAYRPGCPVMRHRLESREGADQQQLDDANRMFQNNFDVDISLRVKLSSFRRKKRLKE